MTNKLSVIVSAVALVFLAATPAAAAERQQLAGHVPEAVAKLHLQPLGRLPATNHLHIAINLPLRNNDALNQLLQELYDPASTNFHRYLTPEQFTERFGPTEQDYQAVIEFAKAHGLTVKQPHPGRAVAGIDGTVADIEKALHVKLFQYQHPVEARTFYAPDVEPSLDLAVPVFYVSDLNNYTVPHRALNLQANATARPMGGSGTNECYLSKDLRNAYAPGSQLTGAGQVIGLALGCGYNPSDIQLYEKLAGITKVQLVPVFQNVTNLVPGDQYDEPSLDIEMAMAMAPGVSNINLYEWNGAVSEAELYQEMAYPTNGETRPNQISTSWSLDTNPYTTNYIRQLAAQGQSYFFFSGDFAAWLVTNYWPGMYFVTMVGGTVLQMTNNGAGWQSESAWNDSTGGYIVDTPIPFYQQGVNMSFNQGSTQWRNIPDVAMCAEDIEVVYSQWPTNGPLQTNIVTCVGGTSASTPLWAGFTALVNQQAAASGKPPVGFLNPAIYAIASTAAYTNCFHDITIGNNTNASSPTAYYATNGYDLVTGWGSPNGTNLINALVNFGGYMGTNISVWVDYNYTGSTQNGTYEAPYKTFAQAVAAVPSGGQIWFRSYGSKVEIMTVSKPMRVDALVGPATIGH